MVGLLNGFQLRERLGTLRQKAVVKADQLGIVADRNAFVGAVKARQIFRAWRAPAKT